MVISHGENKFMFYFADVVDKRRIMLDGSWHFNNSLAVLVEQK